MALSADVSGEESMRAADRAGRGALGRIDILVNNAGVPGHELGDQVFAYLRKVLDVNTLGILACGRAVLPHMKARGGGPIINMAPPLVSRFMPTEAAAPGPRIFPNYAYGLPNRAWCSSQNPWRERPAPTSAVQCDSPRPPCPRRCTPRGTMRSFARRTSLKRMQQPA